MTPYSIEEIEQVSAGLSANDASAINKAINILDSLLEAKRKDVARKVLSRQNKKSAKQG